MLQRIFLSYEKYLHKYPILISSIQTGVLMGAGDVIAQTFIEGNSVQNINIKRTTQFTGLGIFFVGPAVTTWYRFLGRTIGSTGSPVVAIKKVACDQLIFAPCLLGTLVTLINVLRGFSMSDGIQETRKVYYDVMLSNYRIWPLVIMCNFYFVPVRYQILVTQSVAVGWNTYISWKAQSTSKISNKNHDTIEPNVNLIVSTK